MKLEEATILFVDDETDLLEIFSAWLGRSGARILTAPNGSEALKILQAEKVDILVSDIRMPIMDGVELVRGVYDLKLTIPSIIFVSGFGDVTPREMHAMGVEELLEKPLSRRDLLQALERGVMEFEQRWLIPMQEPIAEDVSIEMEGLQDAIQARAFQLGRGGCCFSSNRALRVGATIGVSIRFAGDGQSLKAQGKVRWFDKETSQAGMSFDYLSPDCRTWVIDRIRNGSSRSFIPQCRREKEMPALAEIAG